MRNSDQEYFRSCIAQERHLAQLLGYQHIEECYESAGTLWDGAQPLPAWTRDWAACGPLLVRYSIPIHFPECSGGAEPDHADIGASQVRFSDHPNRDRALMFGIVKEAIRRLEHPRHTSPASSG
ncbi:MAG TPA: aminoacyl-tRNA synthetase [Macromonas sp.]|nr:aminoacyl-tRNA synthetase [Macromonas sp.]